MREGDVGEEGIAADFHGGMKFGGQYTGTLRVTQGFSVELGAANDEDGAAVVRHTFMWLKRPVAGQGWERRGQL